ncbi:MAG TPA: cytochrome ubiquinol oxidase subunit I [Polyangiaceae bacterium]|nr:cytochrome ubiquinol oxidase subunit I [Polyangiaceae bacterium]
MDPLTYARAQMGLSLAFHMVFAAAGIALPALMVVSDALYLRTGERDYLDLSQRLAKGTAILFAVGAVSGTVLSFELGLLWPQFMGTFGELVGLPFALEGFAFFAEAIFLGIYLYGRGLVSPRLHLFAGVAVAASGAASAFFVTLVNAFMNLPAGFRWEGGRPVDVDPVAALFSPPWPHQTLHVLLSCYEAVGFAMAGIHAAMLLRDRTKTFHRRALAIALAVGGAAALAQPLSGDLSAKHLAREQPVKLAAAELHFHTGPRAPLLVGGWPSAEPGEVRGAVEIPGGLSFLAHGDPDAEVKGLRDFPRDEWPPLAPLHASFQIMVGCGVALAGLSLFAAAAAWRKRGLPDSRAFLRAVVAAGPLGFVALEAGWMVTELGRQPWIVRGAMRTADAVTPFPHLAAPFGLFTAVYVLLGAVVAYLLWAQVAKTAPPKEAARAEG